MEIVIVSLSSVWMFEDVHNTLTEDGHHHNRIRHPLARFTALAPIVINFSRKVFRVRSVKDVSKPSSVNLLVQRTSIVGAFRNNQSLLAPTARFRVSRLERSQK